MKKALTAVALAVAFIGAGAQTTTVDSTSGSAAQAGVQSNLSGNTTAIGNVNASRSDSASNSGASSGSQSGALGNVINLDQSVPSNQTINQNLSGSTRAEQILSGGANNTDNIKYSGSVENRVSGGTNSTSTENINQNVHYSGSQTVKNVPGIAMSGPASGPCTGASGGLGLAGPGWGVGLNGSSVMADCRLRENTRVIGMAMQSLDGAANPQEKGEITVMFMDAVRGLAAYNNQIIAEEVKQPKAK